jgi:hypothetical protein
VRSAFPIAAPIVIAAFVSLFFFAIFLFLPSPSQTVSHAPGGTHRDFATRTREN